MPANDDWISRLPTEVAAHVRDLAKFADFPRHLAKFARVYRDNKDANRPVALVLAERAWHLAPADSVVRRDTAWFLRGRVPAWHFGIINDPDRNAIYEAALRRHVRPGMIVFEVGTGTGILAMLAARAGAGHVYTCEREPLIAAVARDNIARNGLADRITVLEMNSHDVALGTDLPQRADLFVSELVDNNLLGEHTLAITRDVRTRLLAPDAIILPDQIEMRCTLVGGPAWTRGFRAGTACGFDVSALDRLGPAQLVADQALAPDLAAEATVFHFDFNVEREFATEEKTLSLAATRAGEADAVLSWIWLRFGAGLEYDNRPPKPSCWAPQLHVLPRTVAVAAGDAVAIRAKHNTKSVRLWLA
ncbi:MAG: hypothetical protein RLZZ15_2103 [Verrucomicrobiota bacterium]|jgi:type II protein arginine methyltransferase